MLDRALEKEFPENDEQSDATDPGSFNNSVAGQQAVLETVARVKSKRNDTKEDKSFQLHDVFNLDNENRPEDTPRLIDSKDNVFIMSNPKSKYPDLQLDLRLISDLVVVIVSATCGGIAFACAGQPVITGYLLAGSVIRPGGLSFVSELVQVETVAQFGVIYLLFALGLEFSAAKVTYPTLMSDLNWMISIKGITLTDSELSNVRSKLDDLVEGFVFGSVNENKAMEADCGQLNNQMTSDDSKLLEKGFVLVPETSNMIHGFNSSKSAMNIEPICVLVPTNRNVESKLDPSKDGSVDLNGEAYDNNVVAYISYTLSLS